MGIIVSFEGLPGTGKTTVIEILMDRFKELGLRTLKVDIEVVDHAQILRLIADQFSQNDPARMMLLWVLRLEQYKAIQEMRGDYDIVFADRSWASSCVIDAFGNGVPREVLDWVGKDIQTPDITLFFDAPLATVQGRKKAKTLEDGDFARRIEKGYREVARTLCWRLIDATCEKEKVTEECMRIIEEKLKECPRTQERSGAQAREELLPSIAFSS